MIPIRNQVNQSFDKNNVQASCFVTFACDNCEIRDEKFRHFNQYITPMNSLKLAKLVLNCPVLNCTLNNKSYLGLLDTEGMKSLIKKECLYQEFPKTEIHSANTTE